VVAILSYPHATIVAYSQVKLGSIVFQASVIGVVSQRIATWLNAVGETLIVKNSSLNRVLHDQPSTYP
jgi:hypothetical protein